MGVIEDLKWRIRKKKGMLKAWDPEKIREQIRKELETEAFLLEEKVRGLELPKETDLWKKQGKNDRNGT